MKASRLTSTGVILALAASMLVTGVVVAGAHGGPPTDKVIHACVDDQTGAVEIVNANARCGHSAHALDWDGEGPRGPRGPAGPQGPPGETSFATTTVVTNTVQFSVATDAALIPVVGVGVDCPGDATATGGGGANTAGSLTSSVPLENDSTVDVAETGDRSTGWWVTAGSFFNGTSGTASTTRLAPQVAPTLTVYAVCAAASPPPWDQDS